MLKTLKKPPVIALLILVLLIGGACAIKAYMNNIDLQETEETSEEQTQTQEEVELTDTELSLLNSYTDEMNEIAGILQSNLWVSTETGSQMTFTDRSCEQVSSTGEATTTSFVLSAAESSTQPNTDSTTTTFVYTFSVSIDDNNYLGTLSQERATGSSEAGQDWTLQCEGFTYTQTYIRSEASLDVSVSGFPSQASDLIGGTDGITLLAQTLSNWCSVNAPDATSARFSGTMTIDFNEAQIDFPLSLSGSTSASSVTAHYLMDTQSFYIGNSVNTSSETLSSTSSDTSDSESADNAEGDKQ